MVNFAVTGASGFIGQRLVPFLQAQGDGVTPLPRALFEREDTVLADAIKGADAVLHLAGRAHRFYRETQNSDDYFFDNVALTERLLAAAKTARVKRFVFVSSIKVNGPRTYGAPFRENDPASPKDPYAQSKHLAEMKIVKFCEENRIEWVILRPPLVYGRDAPGRIAVMRRMIAGGMPLPFANIRNKRSAVSIENFCAILRMAATTAQAANQLYLVADGVDRATPEFLRLLAALDQKRLRLFPFPQALLRSFFKMTGQYEDLETLWEDLQIDTTKLHQHLGWIEK